MSQDKVADVEVMLRGPGSYPLARAALEALQAAGVGPPPRKLELWGHAPAARP